MLGEAMEETATIIETEKLNLGFTSDKENKSKGEVDTKPVETVDSVKESFISDFAVNVVEKYETENVLSEENNSDQICQHEVKDTTKIVDETEDMVESIMSKSINSSSGLQENEDNEDDSIFLIEIEGIGEMQLRVVNNKVSVDKSPKLEKTTTETEQLCPTGEIENIPQELFSLQEEKECEEPLNIDLNTNKCEGSTLDHTKDIEEDDVDTIAGEHPMNSNIQTNEKIPICTVVMIIYVVFMALIVICH